MFLTLVSGPCLAQALDHAAWEDQMRVANDACIATYLQTFGGRKSDRYTDCIAEQTRRATDTCIGTSRVDFLGCVETKSLAVMRACDLSHC